MNTEVLPVEDDEIVKSNKPSPWVRLAKNTSVRVGGFLFSIILLMSLFASLLTPLDPTDINPSNRLKPPGYEGTLRDNDGNKYQVTARMGTDTLGRDIYARVVYGARISLIVGIAVALISVAVGTFIGLVAGYFRWVDAIVMRFINFFGSSHYLLAISLVALSGASLTAVIIAISVPEIPRVVRLVRSIVLSIREEPYVEAAISVGTPTYLILWRHVLPNTVAPLIIQGTYICASAILTEAILSFLGAGINPETPSWGNIMAEGRIYFQINPGIVLWPGLVVSVAILSINLLGDAVRDALDPRMAKRGIER